MDAHRITKMDYLYIIVNVLLQYMPPPFIAHHFKRSPILCVDNFVYIFLNIVSSQLYPPIHQVTDYYVKHFAKTS